MTRIISDFLPIAALIRRELISSLRQARYFYAVLVAVAAAAIVVFTMWPPDRPMPWQMRSASESLFILLGVTLGLGAAVTVPALAGSSIVSEREEETFELLAMTTARPWHVLLAKLVNSAGHYLLLVVALAPFAACAFFLVGMNTEVLWRTLLIVSTTALVCAAAGVLCSAKLKKSMAAVGVSYLAMLFILGLPVLLFLIVLELLGVSIADDFFDGVGMYTMPIISFVVAMGGGPGKSSATSSVVVCSFFNVFVAFVLLVVAHAAVYRNWGMSVDTAPGERTSPQERARGYLPARRFGINLNPLFLRERWYEYPLRGWMGVLQFWTPLGLAFSATSLIVLVRVVEGKNDAEAALVGWQFLEGMLLPLLMAALTANMFTKEHERQNLDALRMTLMRPLELLSGKLMASLRVAALLLAGAAVGSIPLFLFALVSALVPGGWNTLSVGEHVALAFIMFVECLAVTWIVTAFCSLVARRMSSALVMSYVLGAFMLGGIAILVIVVGEGLRLYDVDNWVGMFSPYFAYGLIFDSPTNMDSRLGWTMSHVLIAATILIFLAINARIFTSRHMQDK
ncbi:MAG: ABC transporter permease [Candidatus Hydrogenedentes bacterium]|nr:ABC transporter permease [Candidatus Hydrogenedentota bacterium]